MIEKIYPQIYTPTHLAGGMAQIFLVGNSQNWMHEICGLLKPLSNVVVFKSTLFSFCDDSAKLLWEYTWLQHADSVVFWLPDAPNAAVEFKLKQMLEAINKKIFVGMSADLPVRDYLMLQILSLRPELTIANSIAELAQQACEYYKTTRS